MKLISKANLARISIAELMVDHMRFDFFTGAIFEAKTDEVQSAFKFAMLNHNLNVSSRRFELQAYVDVINTADAFKLSRLSKYI